MVDWHTGQPGGALRAESLRFPKLTKRPTKITHSNPFVWKTA